MVQWSSLDKWTRALSWGAGLRLPVIGLGPWKALPHLLASAREAARGGRYADAAVLYEEALRLRPDDARVRIQAGHMRKDAGDLALAEAHYCAARERLPDDADLALQLGHFYKAAGRTDEAIASYRQASELKPHWKEPTRELDFLHQHGARNARPELQPAHPIGAAHMIARMAEYAADLEYQAAEIAHGHRAAHLAPLLAPRPTFDVLHEHREHIDVRKLGRREPGFWGIRRTLRGVEAIRGFCVSSKPILEMQVILNGVTIHRTPLPGGFELALETDKTRARKYVFNVWLDFSRHAFGSYALQLRFLDADDDSRSFHEDVVIAPAALESDYPASDALVNVPDAVRGSHAIETYIRARPSMVREAARSVFPDGLRTILALRTDQLGDMIVSIPAMRRLREIAPEAKIVGLLTSANANLARQLDLFDEIIVIDFPDDRFERRRLMTLDQQQALRERLSSYEFDLAIDLAQASVSRDLLLLSGARFTFGVGGQDWPWLSGEFGFNTRDRWNGLDTVPHSTKVLALVEVLGAMVSDRAPQMRRVDLARQLIAPLGIGANEPYIVLHAGARIEFSRWPHYPELAVRLIEQTDLKVVLLSDDPGMRARLPDALLKDPRFRFADQRLSFDEFDALISFASIVVGNDSGPKHLAALRGTKVVTLFTARINWAEWGQEDVGHIISRRVPCAGCAIFHDAEECGKDFSCIRDIKVDEVVDTVLRQIGLPSPADAGGGDAPDRLVAG